MKTIVLSLALTVMSAIVPMKKAEAGIITAVATGGATIGYVFMGTGAVLGTIGAVAASNAEGMYNFSGVVELLLGGVILVLDSDSANLLIENFKTVPPYVFDEIKTIVDFKAEGIEANEDGLKEVILLESEVDELFMLMDEETSQADKEKLKEVLNQK